MANHCNRNAALCLAKMLVAAGVAGLTLAACGGGGGSDGGIGDVACLARSTDKSHALACSTNGLPPDALDGFDGLFIEETSPKDGATGVPADSVVRVTFTKAMKTAPSVVVRDQQGHEVAGTVAIDGPRVIFSPAIPLSYAVTYSVVADGGTSADGYDACGSLVVGPCHIEFAFTTLVKS